MIQNPSDYEVACAAAAAALKSINDSLYAQVSDPLDWVPGDFGYISNLNFDGKTYGHEGQNFFFLGNELFYGHASGGRLRKGNEWWDHVNQFSNPNGASLDPERVFPAVGLSEFKR